MKKNVNKNLLLSRIFHILYSNYLSLNNACWLKFDYFSDTKANVILKRNTAKIKCAVAKLLTSGVFQNGGRKQFCFVLLLMSPATLANMVPFLCFSIYQGRHDVICFCFISEQMTFHNGTRYTTQYQDNGNLFV